ncbi:MAG: hypothetical protein Q7J72_07530 [Candidatus Omnitrophota bacterium]|nr:hypothetical protein [Candidatus Omnitrophota bacterium]
MSRHKVSFSIAGVNFELESDKAEPVRWLRARYAPYLSQAMPGVRISLCYNSRRLPPPGKKLLCGPYIIYENRGRNLEFKIYAKGSYIALGDVLRFLISLVLLENGGFLLHSCGVIIDGGAYLFSGPSGAGKTTLARLLPQENGETILSDETTAITKNSGGYYGWATPFFGDFGSIGANNKSALKAIFFLKQARRFKLKRLEPVYSSARLLGNIFLLGGNWRYNYNIDRLCDAALGCSRKVAAYELEFLPNKRVWNYIKEKISPGG